MAELHDRMPVILELANWPASLGESESDPRSLLHLSPDGALRKWPVDARLSGTWYCSRDLPHGLRVSEAIDLRWSDFDLEAPKSCMLHVRRLKGSKDSVHALEPDTSRRLKRLHAETDRHYVFRSQRGGPMSVDVVQLICERAGEQAGLPFRVHRTSAPCLWVLSS